MRHILILIILCLFPFAGIQAQTASPTDSSVVSDSVNGKEDHSASLQELVREADQKDSIDVFCRNIQQTQTQQEYLIGGMGIICLILLIVVLLMFVKLQKVSTKRKKLREDFESWRKTLKDPSYLNNIAQKILPNVEARVQSLLNNYNAPMQKNTSVRATETIMQQPPVAKPSSPVVRYFGTNSGNYFVQAYNDQNPTTAFKVIFVNEQLQEGEFSLVDLHKIKSSDSISLVVEFVEGSKKLDSAKEAIPQQDGKVVKDGNSWKIVRKLKLKLY